MIHPSAKVGENVSMGENVAIGPNAEVGDGVELRNNVVVYEGTRIGAHCTVYDNAVLGRPPHGTGAMTRRPQSDLPPLSLGPGCVVGACVVLYRGTTIGEATLIGDRAGVREQCDIGAHCIIGTAVTVAYHTRIGNGVKIMDHAQITGNAVIEDEVFIGPMVSSTNDPSLDRAPSGPGGYRGAVIRRGAGIGALTVLMPAVEVGERAMVASGSVVVRPVPARTVVAGTPARAVRKVRSEWLPEGGHSEPEGDEE